MDLSENGYESLLCSLCEGKENFVKNYGGVEQETFYTLICRLKDERPIIVEGPKEPLYFA